MRVLALSFVTLATFVVLACGEDVSIVEVVKGIEVVKEVPVERIVEVEKVVSSREVAGTQTTVEVADSGKGLRDLPRAPGADPAEAQVELDESTAAEEAIASLVTQRRVIVRTAEMSLVVSDVTDVLDAITEMADGLGGWVVSLDHRETHRGSISIRVPAEHLVETITRVRTLAVEVESEIVASRDVTDEYVDKTARLRNFRTTEEALLKLMDLADTVTDALKVQQSVTATQTNIELLQGQIKLLEETSAFSLIRIDVELVPGELRVDAGPDKTFAADEVARFRATFPTQQDIEDYTFTWDFGDGSNLVQGTRTAPTLDGGVQATDTVTHVYSGERDSPFIAEVEIVGMGRAGVVRGSDAMIVTITKVPTIEVFAGESRIVVEDELVEFGGSFTRPIGLIGLIFTWDFGDGSRLVTGGLDEEGTTAIATHTYPDHRPLAYTATLTLTGQSKAGEVQGSVQPGR